MCKNAVKKLPFVISCVLDRYKTCEMCDKVILENDGKLKFVFHFNKSVDDYDQAL